MNDNVIEIIANITKCEKPIYGLTFSKDTETSIFGDSKIPSISVKIENLESIDQVQYEDSDDIASKAISLLDKINKSADIIYDSKCDDLSICLLKSMQKIYQKTLRYQATYIIISPDLFPYISRLSEFYADQEFPIFGSHIVGKFEDIPVVMSSALSKGKFFLGVNGSDKLTFSLVVDINHNIIHLVNDGLLIKGELKS